MSEIAIHVENLSKSYRIAHQAGGKRYKTLREDLVALPRRLSGLARGQSGTSETFWALKDVSFDVHEGEVVGIIGRNGAGKSTLLKILSRITEPTRGRAEIYGRVGSLLEVGTGFHPELTGRENVFLSGAVLGMTRAEVQRKFDEIVAFAEVEKFLDTPAKHYSSGMYVRLGFAVAAHLEPEILVVDEVLAVGDAEFQKKCLGKMGDVAKEGRTVLFVSHNMQAIRHLCSRAVLLERGGITSSGATDTVIGEYLQSLPQAEGLDSVDTLIRQLPPDPAFRLESVRLIQVGKTIGRQVLNGDPLEIEICYQVLERTTGLRVFFDFCDNEDTLLFRSFNDEQATGILQTEPGRYSSKAVIPADLMSPTTYELRIYATVFNVRMCIPAPGIRIPLNVERSGRVNQAYVIEPIRGKLAPLIPWTTSRLPECN